MNTLLPRLTRHVFGDVTWLTAPELDPVLFNERGLRLAEWLRSGQARIVKQAPHRAVYRIDLDGQTLYLKHNRSQDTGTWMRELIRTSKARKEFESALAVAARGVPTILPLAIGEQYGLFGPGESFLVSRGLEQYQPLNSFLAGVLPTIDRDKAVHIRHSLADELGKIVAQMHEAGIQHNDFHAANILIRLDDENRLSLAIIDLNSVTLGETLDWYNSMRNLAMLNSWFVQRVSGADRLRFWRSYCQARHTTTWWHEGSGWKHTRPLIYEIEQRTWEFNYRTWARRTRRCLRNTRHYRRIEHGSLVGHIMLDLDPKSLQQILSDPDGLFKLPGTKILKDSPTCTVAELEMIVDGKPRSVIYKKFSVVSLKDPLASLVRPTPALRSWIHGQGFRERGLPTARPLAVLHRMRFGIKLEGYLVTEKLENVQELSDFFREVQSLDEPLRRSIRLQKIDQIARLIRDMHRRNISHRDLKAANVLVRRWNAPEREPTTICMKAIHELVHMPESSVSLIDLVGVEIYKRLKHSRRVQNLARLNASFINSATMTRTDRLRFLRTYMNWNVSGKGDWKRWWHEIEAATMEKVARNRRRNRPLA